MPLELKNEISYVSVLLCFRHLSYLTLKAASKRLILVPEQEDTGLDQVADKRVVPGCNLELVLDLSSYVSQLK